MTGAVATPPSSGERFETLDVLRGLGVLGILAVNAVAFAWPWQAYQNPTNAPHPFEGWDVTAWFVTRVFFELKFITLFTFLFAASLCLIGGEKGDVAGGSRLRRRLMWLGVFGLMHGALLWFGDILLTYAIVGGIALLCRSWSVRRLVQVGLSLFVLGSFLNVAFAFLPEGPAADSIGTGFWSPERATLLEITAAFRSPDAVAANFGVWVSILFTFLFTTLPRTLGVMLIGIALFRSGVLQGRADPMVYRRFAFVGLIALGLIAWESSTLIAENFAFPRAAGLLQLGNYFLSPLVTLLYVSIIVWLVRGRALSFVRGALGAVGRMAFSNYIAQSLIMTTIFYGWGFARFGEATHVELVGLVALIWTAQLIWSPLYLMAFRYGPLEWVWRSLTEGRAVAIRRAPPSAPISPAEAR